MIISTNKFLSKSLAIFSLTSRTGITFGFSPAHNARTSTPQYVRNASTAKGGHNAHSHELHANLITFDLDDTIFPVGPVIADANQALFSHLSSLGCDTTQDDYLATTKQIRTELAEQDEVITYTELRKRAIRTELTKYLVDDSVSDEMVVGSYDLWEEHRHIAAERHLYSDTIPMLKELKANHEGVVIAAITNGKGNPLRMDSISEYFDYCVSGEDSDVFPLRKPSGGIYNVALERFRELCHNRGEKTLIGDSNDGSEKQQQQCWIHVGDDLANDVGASAECGANAIWVDLEEGYGQTASKRDPNAPQPAWSTATKEELEKRKRMNEQAQEYVSERVTTLGDLPMAVQKISNSVLQSSCNV